MTARRTWMAAASLALGGLFALPAAALETIKIGLILQMTGPFASAGRQVSAGAKTFMAMKGDTVAGKKIEVVLDISEATVSRIVAEHRQNMETFHADQP